MAKRKSEIMELPEVDNLEVAELPEELEVVELPEVDNVPCRDIPMACSVPEAVDMFWLHGWCILSPSLVELPEDLVQTIHNEMWAYVPSAGNCRWNEVSNEGYDPNRFSMNSFEHVHSPNWRQVCKTLFHDTHPFSQFMTAMTGGFDKHSRWFFDRAGGDKVLPGGHGQRLHSDHPGWSQNLPALIVASLSCRALPPNAAPISIMSNKTGKEYLALLPVGALLVRDCNCWHRGTANTSSVGRCLPAIRLFHVGYTNNWEWRPPRSVSDQLFREYFPEQYMADRMQYLWNA